MQNLQPQGNVRHDWTASEVDAFFCQPLNDLLYQAHQVHRANFDPNAVQISTLLSIKTGACPEDCKYCPQSIRYETSLEREELLAVEQVAAAARQAKERGASRFCMGAAWRHPKDRDIDKVIPLLKAVQDEGMETCLTLGMLTAEQSDKLKRAGLDYYNHNLDTSPEYYEEVVTTRTYQDRLDTLENVRRSGMNVCAGGIIGMGEERKDRVGLLIALANLPEHPQSVPINNLVQVKGTPLHGIDEIDPLEFVRTIAVARLMMPESVVRLSAGRTDMSEELQAMCFFAGANSIFYGDKLLTTDNPGMDQDQALLKRLGIKSMPAREKCKTSSAA